MAKLRGLAWDHRRCWGPLEASVARLQAATPGRDRLGPAQPAMTSAKAPLEAVLAAYDLVVFDHPFVGEIAEGGLMVPFDEHLTDEAKAFFERDSVGKSWQSYQREGRPMGAADRRRLPGRVLSAGPAVRPTGRCLEPSTMCWSWDARHAQGRQMARPAAGPDRRHVPDPDA